MKTYVINLKSSTDRKQYMEKLLMPYNDFLDVHFVEAVDGRQLSNEELNAIWNQYAAYKNYGRHMTGGEIGVALSQRECYDEILKNGDEIALIFEDDVAFRKGVDLKKVFSFLEDILRTEKPTIILLSGSYWFTSLRKISGDDYQLASVFEAMGAMSYLINKAAAQKMLSVDKKYLADDWYNWKRHDIEVYALHPHIAGDISLFSSAIAGEGWKRKNLPFENKIRAYHRGVIRRILGGIGHFEKR